jgi:hypothetical protein
MTISGYKKAIARLLKAYKKKYDALGRERKNGSKKSRA